MVCVGAFFHEESHAKHSSSLTFSSSPLFLISFPCHLSSDTVDCISCWRALQIPCLTFLASTSLPSATATGLGEFNHNCRSSSSAYFLGCLMMEWRPFCTASSSNDLTAAIVCRVSVAIKLYCFFDLSVLVFILHGLETSSTELPRHVEYRCRSLRVISSILHDDLSSLSVKLLDVCYRPSLCPHQVCKYW